MAALQNCNKKKSIFFYWLYGGIMKTKKEEDVHMFILRDNLLEAVSKTTKVVFDGCKIVSIQNVRTGEEFLQANLQEDVPGFEIEQISKVSYSIGTGKACTIHYRKFSDNIMEIVVGDWEADVSVKVEIEEETGDILVEPSMYTIMNGITSLRMNIAGIRKDLKLIAPFQQGICLNLDDDLLKDIHYEWPFHWEAGFVILQGRDSGFSVQVYDNLFKAKAIKLGFENNPYVIGFENCAYGPVDRNQAIGGLVWRIFAYEGDWIVPAEKYRNWMWKAYNLDYAIGRQPEWINDVKLAISWCPTDGEFLDALARKVNPHNVVLHLPDWRIYKYDQDYPEYVPSEQGKEFIKKARNMGYHVLPHCNAYQISPDHPLFFHSINFSAKNIYTKRLMGWGIILEGEKLTNIGPPQSYSSILSNKDMNLLVNVHPGFTPWRRELTYQIAKVTHDLDLDGIFIDVTLVMYNADNNIVENMTYVEGALRLIKEIGEIKPYFAVGGEGRNEISTQYLSFAQFHLFKFAHGAANHGESVDWLQRATFPVNDFIFKGLARGLGYNYGLPHQKDNARVMIEATQKLGAIPTLIVSRKLPSPAEAINNPDENVKRILELALG